jgi:hypothetical protein
MVIVDTASSRQVQLTGKVVCSVSAAWITSSPDK